MPYEWTGPGTLTRVNGANIEPGERFEPTDAELSSFATAITEVDTDSEMEATEPDANPTGEADTDVSEASDDLTVDDHWKAAVSDIEAGEYDDRLGDVEDADDRESVQNAVEERRAEL